MTPRLASTPLLHALSGTGLGLALAGCGAATPAAEVPVVVAVPQADAAHAANGKTDGKDGQAGAAAEKEDPAAARRQALQEAAEYAMSRLLGPGDLKNALDGGLGGVLGGAPSGTGFGAGGLGLSGPGAFGLSGVGAGGGGGGALGLGSGALGRGSGGGGGGALGIGSIGTIGRGSGGGGTGYGVIGGSGGGNAVSGQSVHVSGDMVIALGDAVTLGVSQESAARVMRDRVYALRGCYAKALEKNRQLAGTVAVRLVVGKAGRVALARDLGSDLADPEAVTCVLDAMKDAYVSYVSSDFFGVIETTVRFSKK